MIKVVIFDFDDTLAESRIKKWAQHKHVAKKFYGIDLVDDEIRKHWGKPMHILVSELYKNRDTLENMREALHSTKEDFYKELYPGALDIIENLISRDIKVGILSASDKRSLDYELGRLNFPIEKLFLMQGADDSMVHKPDPGVFSDVLEKLENEGIEKQKVVYVGDSLDDIRAAHGAGINFIAVTTGLYSKEDFEKEGAKHIADSIEKVLEYI